jgi:hypothetical protein
VNYRVLTEAHGEAMEAVVWMVVHKRYDVARKLWRMWSAGQDAIQANPRRYPKAEDGTKKWEVRNYILPKYGYRIVYQLTSEEIVVLAFCRGRRRPAYWAERIQTG